ncbi:hypothetical protein As57867_019996, partial [Aphanomyces stellatus]
GDPYSGVREHETGGTYGVFPTQGAKAIGACYTPGSTVDITVQLTANHMGHFTFGLCKLNGKHDKETEECFQTLAQPDGQQQWPVPSGNDFFTMKYTLPKGVTCDGDAHCVLRWSYTGGNNPGVGDLGQEWFWNCADVYISNTCGAAPAPSSSTPTYAPVPSSSTPTYAPAPSSASPTYAPAPSSANPTYAPAPSSSSTPAPQPPAGLCGTCNNCLYPGTNACFIGWTEGQCKQVSAYKWCGQPTMANKCGKCNNCYYAAADACFIGWTAAQCAQVPQYSWCGDNAVVPTSNTPSSSYPTVSPSAYPSTSPSYAPTPSSYAPATPTPSSYAPVTPAPSTITYAPSPSSGGVSQTISWNWFASSTTDCDGSLSKDTLNTGFYIGSENVPADCGKTATFTFLGKSVTATVMWRTTGGTSYHELSPNAFAKLLGSSADAANFNNAAAFQAAINDPGHVTATCTGTC